MRLTDPKTKILYIASQSYYCHRMALKWISLLFVFTYLLNRISFFGGGLWWLLKTMLHSTLSYTECNIQFPSFLSCQLALFHSRQKLINCCHNIKNKWLLSALLTLFSSLKQFKSFTAVHGFNKSQAIGG